MLYSRYEKPFCKKKLKPGDRLPSEKELAQHFGVSKASVREAFRALEALGFLEVYQGVSGGAYVKEIDFEIARENLSYYIFFQNPSIKEFTELRMIFEPKVAEIIAQNITENDIKKIENILIETQDALNTEVCFYELDIAFHKEIAKITNNKLLVFIIDSMQNALVNIKKFYQPDFHFSEQVYRDHVSIFEALKNRDPVAARSAMFKHIEDVESGLEALSSEVTPD